MGEKGVDSNFVEITNSTVTLFNQLSSTNKHQVKPKFLKFRHQAEIKKKLEFFTSWYFKMYGF